MTDKFTLPKIPSKLWNIGGEGRHEAGKESVKESKSGSRQLLKVSGLKSPRGEHKETGDPESPRSPRSELSSRSAKSSAWREETLKNTQTTNEVLARPLSQAIDRQSSGHEYLATCALEHRKTIQSIQSEHKNADKHVLTKILLDLINIRIQYQQAEEKTQEKMNTFQEDNQKTFQELEELKQTKIRTQFLCIQKENRLRASILRAKALFVVAQYYSTRFNNKLCFLSVLKTEINKKFSISLEINKTKMQKTFYSNPLTLTGSDIDNTQIITATESTRKEVKRLSTHIPNPEKDGVKIQDLPDVKPDLTLSMPLDFADLIGINLEEYTIMREVTTQLQQKNNVQENQTKEKIQSVTFNEPSGLLTNRSPLKDAKGSTNRKQSASGVKGFLGFVIKDKAKSKK